MSLNHFSDNKSTSAFEDNSWCNVACNSALTKSLEVKVGPDNDASIKILARNAGKAGEPTAESFLYGGIQARRLRAIGQEDPTFYPILTWDNWTGGGGIQALDKIYIQTKDQVVATFTNEGLAVNGKITSTDTTPISQSNISYKEVIGFSSVTTDQAVVSKLITSFITDASTMNDIFADLKVGDSFQFKCNGTWISTGVSDLLYRLSFDGNAGSQNISSGTFPISTAAANGSITYECNFSVRNIVGFTATIIQSTRMCYSRSSDQLQRVSFSGGNTASVGINDPDFTFILAPSTTNLAITMHSCSLQKMK